MLNRIHNLNHMVPITSTNMCKPLVVTLDADNPMDSGIRPCSDVLVSMTNMSGYKCDSFRVPNCLNIVSKPCIFNKELDIPELKEFYARVIKETR